MNLLTKLGKLPPGSLLASLDVTALYTNIPHADGIQAIENILKPHSNTLPCPLSTITHLAEFVLASNAFTFDGEIYLQTQGTAMGTRMAPSYANLFMGDFERKLLRSASHTPEIWLRFIDDIFLAWIHGRDSLNKFIEAANCVHPSIKLTYDISDSKVTFLDTEVHISPDGTIETRLYSKPTDSHSYLHPKSCHPSHTTRSIPYSQALRLRRICSSNDIFWQQAPLLHDWFTARGIVQTW